MNPDIVEIHNSCKVKVINKQSPSTSELDKLLRVTGTCNPIYSIKELILWKANNQQCLWQDFVIPRAATTNHKVAGFGFNCHDNKDELQLTRLVGNSTPKTILCHDYKGGYLEDRFPYGVETDDIYSFFHWSAIDIFIYFSHNIVTIPTLPWMNAAHRHGCKVLGTFITESDSGKEAWDEILKSEENFTAVIENLAEICRFFKFDGYLLNIENAIPTQHVPRLIEFVKLLTEKLHSISPDYEVIWYDSVIAPSGNLRWQNKLCSLNRVFFDLCDGIFLNYCWSEQDLIDSVSLADVRRHDVYMGVDVFGRGCIGGGGFNSSQAMKLIHKHGLSTAIFAPGWTFEKCSNVELFLRREMLFWNNIWPYLFIHGPVTLPFKTSFCIGRGKNKWHMGSIVGDKWGCLTNQQYQLSTCYCPGREDGETDSTSCLDIATSESFQGGTCIEIVNHNNRLEINKSMIRLFTCGFSYSGQIIIYLTHKSTSPIALVLFVQDEKRIRKVFLASVDCLDELSDTNSRVRKIERNSHIDIMKRFSKQAHQNGWSTDIFVYDLIGRTIIEIDFVNLGVEKSTVLLGELSLQKIIKVPSH